MGVEKAVWVVSTNLSAGVASNFKASLPLKRGAKAQVNRCLADEQKKFLLNSPVSKSKKVQQFKDLNPIKMAARTLKWSTVCQTYVRAINKILDTKTSKRKAVRKQVVAQLPHFSNYVQDNLAIDNFLSGRLVQWQKKEPVLQPLKSQPGMLRCMACEKNFKFPALARALYHVTCKDHHACCRKQNDKRSAEQSAQVLKEELKTASSKILFCFVYLFLF